MNSTSAYARGNDAIAQHLRIEQSMNVNDFFSFH